MLNVRIARALVLVLCASGCRQVAGIEDPLPWDGGDSGSNSGDGSVEDACYGTGIVQLCLGEPASGATMLPDGTLDTDSSPLCATNVISGGTGACVVAGNTVVLPTGGVLVATGSKPLIVVAHDSITISGTLSVASRREGSRGAGSSTGTCNAAAAPTGGGGGAGGSFGGLGGDGGGPNTTTAGPTPPAPTSLRGGCDGQAGSGSGGSEGAGGGATFLIAKVGIDVTGSINASGAGADKPDSGIRGGSGGGSGGMIGLDAPMVQVAGSVFANGGGGSGGSDSSSEGDDGNDPVAGSGGSGGGGSGTAGNGGNGAAGATLDGMAGGSGTAGSSGGGGGGGGAGVVKLYGTRAGAGTISPPPT